MRYQKGEKNTDVQMYAGVQANETCEDHYNGAAEPTVEALEMEVASEVAHIVHNWDPVGMKGIEALLGYYYNRLQRMREETKH
jgi:hypothetical protein